MDKQILMMGAVLGFIVYFCGLCSSVRQNKPAAGLVCLVLCYVYGYTAYTIWFW